MIRLILEEKHLQKWLPQRKPFWRQAHLEWLTKTSLCFQSYMDSSQIFTVGPFRGNHAHAGPSSVQHSSTFLALTPVFSSRDSTTTCKCSYLLSSHLLLSINKCQFILDCLSYFKVLFLLQISLSLVQAIPWPSVCSFVTEYCNSTNIF